MANKLTEIKRKDLATLKNLYSPNDSTHAIALMAVENYIKWFETDPNVKHIQFFCLNGDFSDGTFVVTDRCSAYADTANRDYTNLSHLIQLIDYSKGYVFLSVRPELRSVIQDALNKANVEGVRTDMTLLYYLPKQDALKFNIQPPADIELRKIMENIDLEKANSVWPHGNPNSFPFFQRMAKYNSNIGAYNTGGTLLAWLFRLPTGLLGALQTDEKYYGRGYGSLVAKVVSKQIAEQGHDIYAGIFEGNTPSLTLFGKLGFKSIGEVYWISTKITWSSDDE